jgi:hypothetical protein
MRNVSLYDFHLMLFVVIQNAIVNFSYCGARVLLFLGFCPAGVIRVEKAAHS